MGVKFCLSPSKFVNFNENVQCSDGRRHDVTCSCRKCYLTFGHNIIYDMTLFNE